MKGRLVLACGLLALLVVVMNRGAASLPTRAMPAARSDPRPRLAEPPTEPRPPIELRRDLFRYADVRPSAAPVAPVRPIGSAVTPQRAVPDSPVRLVGFIRKAGRLAAAISVLGELVVATPGAAAGAYTVLAVDEEQGVRLRGPDGTETRLPPP